MGSGRRFKIEHLRYNNKTGPTDGWNVHAPTSLAVVSARVCHPAHASTSCPTALAENNYVAKETGRVMCPACLYETPYDFTICFSCHGMLVSYGERDQKDRGGDHRREDEQGKAPPAGGGQASSADVNMEEDEIDEVVRKAKAKAKKAQEADDQESERDQAASSSGAPMLDNRKIQHVLTSEITGMFNFCFHVAEIKNVDAIFRAGIRPAGRRGGRMQIFFSPFAPWDQRFENMW